MISNFDNPLILEIISRAIYVRKFEELLLNLYADGKIYGTTHTCIGQELVAAVVGNYLEKDDFVFSNHRGHGHFLTTGGDSLALLYEILGDIRGVCGGVGGSQHLYSKNFLANGILAGNSGFAVGLALSKKSSSTGIVVYYMGDGSICEGIFYEALNMASLYRTPVLFVIENNDIAQTTLQQEFLAGSIVKRFEAFGINSMELDDYNLEENLDIVNNAIKTMRNDRKPFGLVFNTRRLGPHSKGDDTRSTETISKLKDLDLISFFQKKCPSKFKLINDHFDLNIKKLERACQEEGQFKNPITVADNNYFNFKKVVNTSDDILIKQIRSALECILQQKNNTIILGEDILDPYGGAFKATLGLSSKYPNQIISTPISEAALVGLSGGLSMGGILPILEIMFGDFVTLCFDQIVNHISKYDSMYSGIFKESILIRMPMGGYRGYGATHSQALEKYLLGIPGIYVVAVNLLFDVDELYQWAIRIKKPVILIENKSDYVNMPLFSAKRYSSILEYQNHYQSNGMPIIEVNVGNIERNVVLIAYGNMIDRCIQAAINFYKQTEISSSVISITFINKMDYETLNKIVKEADLVVIVEEGTNAWGWGAEIQANLFKKTKVIRHAVTENFIPSGIKYEKKCLPSVESIQNILNENAT